MSIKALTVHQLEKFYGDNIHALKKIDFSVDAGDFFALLGPNGAGKSTTLGIITSLVNKSSGKVSVFNHDIDKQPEQAKQCIGLVPQEFNFNMFEPIFDILTFQGGFYGLPSSLAKQRAETYLKKLDLWDRRNAAPNTLSGGMKRRFMLARALVHQPKLLVLDEPTAGVDIEIRRFIWDFIREINQQGTTVILTTHYLEEAENLCRNIAIIDQGKIVKNTDMKSLLQQLNTETFIFYLKDPLPSTDLTFNGYNYRKIDDTTLEIDVDKSQPLNLLFTHLSKTGIEVLTMRNKSNRLEELFLMLINQNEAPHG